MTLDDEASSVVAFGSRDFVPDAATALQVGVAILRAYFDQRFFELNEPYTAILDGGKWHIMGDAPAQKAARAEQERLGPDHVVLVRGGGAPCLVISPRDARVEKLYLMR
jgi:hypothetical protein